MFHRRPVHSAALILAALPWATATADSPDERLYPFLVAVQDYTTLKALTTPRADLTDLARLLREAGVPRNRLTLMHEKQPERFQPTAEKVRKELDLLLSGLGAEDAVLFAFAGHAVQFKDEKETYLCPGDANLDNRATLHKLADLYSALAKCKAGRKLVLLDACRQGPAEGDRLLPIARPQDEKVPEGLTVVFSCAAGQQGLESPRLERGLFFHYLTEGLRDKVLPDREAVPLGALLHQARIAVRDQARSELAAVQMVELRGKADGGMLPRAAPVGGAPAVVNSVGMKLVRIKPGEFLMGAEEGKEGVETEITRPFYLGAYEVRQKEYEKIRGKNPSKYKFSRTDTGFGIRTDTYPDSAVESVSWHDAVEFCKRLSELPEEKQAGRVYRLPSEAEWEYACRAGTKTRFWWGNDDDKKQYGTSQYGKVGMFNANPWGLYDVHGGVAEWCLDRYEAARPIDPQDPEIGDLTAARVIRGGASAASRDSGGPGSAGETIGFRVLMTTPAPPRGAAPAAPKPADGPADQADALKKDQLQLAGQWHSPRSKSGDTETYRTLTLGKPGSPVMILRTVVKQSGTGFSLNSTDEIKQGIPVVGATREKAGKRVLTIQDFGNVYEVEYELSGDTLQLRGQVAGVDLSGTWTSAKKK
jgi:formylglycine-generating enzyme required for sulfatase activity